MEKEKQTVQQKESSRQTIEFLKEEITRIETEKGFLSEAVDAKDKEIAVLKLKLQEEQKKHNEELKNMSSKIATLQDELINYKNSESTISFFKKQAEMAQEGEKIRAMQLQELMKFTSNFLNSFQPSIENNISLFNALVEKIGNTFKNN